MSISPNSPVCYAQMLRAKDKMMRLLGLFQQAGPFLVTSKQSYRETENRDHFFSLLYSVIPSFYTTH
jgi:hypothetical protein